MKNKYQLILLAFHISLCLLLIKWQRKRVNAFFRKGGSFLSGKSLKMYNSMNRQCDRAMLLSYRYQKLISKKNFSKIEKAA